MWLLWIVVFAVLLCAGLIFAFPGAIPIVAIVVVVVLLLNAPLIFRSLFRRDRDKEGVERNWQGEVTDLGYVDEGQRVPRAQGAVFFGTPDVERHRRGEQGGGRADSASA
jgi:membrane protein implicated in regulation of membrane protease activity